MAHGRPVSTSLRGEVWVTTWNGSKLRASHALLKEIIKVMSAPSKIWLVARKNCFHLLDPLLHAQQSAAIGIHALIKALTIVHHTHLDDLGTEI